MKKNILLILFNFSLLFGEISKETYKDWILDALNSQDVSVKIYIVENIKDIPFKKFYPEVKKLILSKNDNLKLKSLYTLYKVYKDTSSIKQIKEFVLQKPKINVNENSTVNKAKIYLKNQIRAEAVKILGEIGDEKTLDLLSITVNDEDGNVKDASYFALALLSERGVINKLPEIKEFFYSGLKDLNPKVRLQAVKYIGDLKYTDAVGPLTLRLKDSNKQVIIEAIYSLGKIGDISVLSDLLQFKNHPYDNIRLALVESLGIIANNINFSTNTTKINTIIKIKNVLNEMLNDTNGMVRVASSRSLLSLNDRSAIEIIKKGLNSNDIDVIIYCIETIGKYGVIQDIELIERFIQHQDIFVKAAAYVNILKIYFRNENNK